MRNLRTKCCRNGNTLVAICDDGSKYRYTPDGRIPTPGFPESIDLKITDYCEEGCPMCHEDAGPCGRHGNLNHSLLDSIPPYTEIAIGGGDPMTHPDLYSFLQRMKKQEVICNITVHYNQFRKSADTLHRWQTEGLIHGVGVSINHPLKETTDLETFAHLVVQTIAGVADPETFKSLADKNLNLLILGYKNFGRGTGYHMQNEDVERKIQWVADHIGDLSEHFRSVCFDNLAVEQLDLKNKITHAAWKQFYMGEDGKFTMYVDLVKNEYAASSVSERKAIFSDDIRDLFQTLHFRAEECLQQIYLHCTAIMI